MTPYRQKLLVFAAAQLPPAAARVLLRAVAAKDGAAADVAAEPERDLISEAERLMAAAMLEAALQTLETMNEVP